ncbi:hypothetical protein MMX123_02744 [Microbacterium sp. MM2322]
MVSSAGPASAWGSVTLGPPATCNGQAYGSSWTTSNGGIINAITYESGNFCAIRQKVSVGLWQAWGGTNPVFVYSAFDSASTGGPQQGNPPGRYRGGYHAWGEAKYS